MSGGQSHTNSVSVDRSRRVHSRLLPEVFPSLDDLDPERLPPRPTVLDLGPGSASTLNFLNQHRARVFFADVTESPLYTDPKAEREEELILNLIDDCLALPEDLTIDVILLWDYLHGFSLETLRLISYYLMPRLARDCVGYGFGALHQNTAPDANQYSIVSADQLEATTRHTLVPTYSHTQQRLTESFGCLKIARATLLQEGRLELLFQLP